VAAIARSGNRVERARPQGILRISRSSRPERAILAAQPAQLLLSIVVRPSNMMAERMQVSIEQFDAAGNVVGQTTSWALGTLPAGNRSYF
jgi:hypothetical protein